jgi:hypothetical protein
MALTMAFITGCGGGGGSASNVDTASPWSSPQIAKVAFDDRSTISAHADNCGGINVLGTVSNKLLAQRFTPTSGWQEAVSVIPAELVVAGRVQRLDVGTVPTLYFRDQQNWYSAHFDCTTKAWTSEVALPVEYRPATAYNNGPQAIEVGFSETYAHKVLAVWSPVPGNTVSMKEYSQGIWGTSTSASFWVYSGIDWESTTKLASIESVSMVRAKDADVALVSYGTGSQYVASRSAAANSDFLPTSLPRGCLGHFCAGYALYEPPKLELDGSATVFLGINSITPRDWFRADASGLTSIWGGTAAYAIGDRLLQSVGADGTSQWATYSYPDSAGQPTSTTQLFEKGVQAVWNTQSSAERSGCGGSNCRAFSTPDTSHLVTVLNVGVTPATAPLFAISDRTGVGSWVGTSTAPLDKLLVDGPTANGAGVALQGNDTIKVLKYHAAGTLQMVVATLGYTRTGSTTQSYAPFIVWQ